MGPHTETRRALHVRSPRCKCAKPRREGRRESFIVSSSFHIQSAMGRKFSIIPLAQCVNTYQKTIVVSLPLPNSWTMSTASVSATAPSLVM